MTAEQIMDRYPWVSKEDAERIAKEARTAAQQRAYDEATRLKPR